MFDLRTQDRLEEWVNIRNHIDTLPTLDAIYYVNDLWNKAPIDKDTYSPSLSNEWPGPWELMADGHFDSIGKMLGIGYTLYLCKTFKEHQLEFCCTLDIEESKYHNLVLVDQSKYVLNLDLDVQLNIEQLPGQLTKRINIEQQVGE